MLGKCCDERRQLLREENQFCQPDRAGPVAPQTVPAGPVSITSRANIEPSRDSQSSLWVHQGTWCSSLLSCILVRTQKSRDLSAWVCWVLLRIYKTWEQQYPYLYPQTRLNTTAPARCQHWPAAHKTVGTSCLNKSEKLRWVLNYCSAGLNHNLGN